MIKYLYKKKDILTYIYMYRNQFKLILNLEYICYIMYICVYNVFKMRYFVEYENMIIIYVRVKK